MGDGIASWPFSSLLISAAASVFTLSPSAALREKHCWQKDFSDRDNTVNSVLHTTDCNTYVATVRVTFPCVLAIVWTVEAHNDPNHHGCRPGAPTIPGCFLRHCQGKDTSSVLSACVRLIDCYWKQSSFTSSQVWTADTQQVESMQTVCQGLIKAACVGRGMKVNIMQASSVCVCVCVWCPVVR